MRLLGKSHILSLWSLVLQDDHYIQGCKDSVLLPALSFLKLKGPGEIVCLRNFHFLNASVPCNVTCECTLAGQFKPLGFPCSSINLWAAELKAQKAKELPANGPGRAMVIHKGSVIFLFLFCFVCKVVHFFTEEFFMRPWQELALDWHRQRSCYIITESHMSEKEIGIGDAWLQR